MDKIIKKIETLKQVNNSLPLIVFDLAIMNEQIILTMNKEQMENDGVRGDGQQINRIDRDYVGYHPITISYKKEKGQPYDRVTLRDTGDFHRGLKLYFNYQDDYFYLWSEDEKTQKLIGMYGNEVFGLTDQNMSILIENLRPQITSILKERIIYG